MTDLYAWAAPALGKGAPVDHTWVTTYDNRTTVLPSIADVVAAREDDWFCWGNFHAAGGTPALPDGYLCHRAGDPAFARCVATSNMDSRTVFHARGTIFSYGVDGVCHQLTNQILHATSLSGMAPSTAAGARGYRASTAVYGTYGLQHAAWRAKLASCSRPPSAVPGGTTGSGGGTMSLQGPSPPTDDEFGDHVGRVLGIGKMADASRILQMRAQFQASAAMGAHAMTAATADELNARNQRFFDAAAKILSRDDFIAVFEFAPGEAIDLVVPNLGP